MALVYRAKVGAARTDVAVKVLKPEHARDIGLVRRFEREIVYARSLSHPNVAPVLGDGRLPDGRAYYVMELYRGSTLGDRVRRQGALPLPQALAIVDGILAGVGALQFVEAAAEMQSEQIALVAQDRKERTLAVLSPLHRGDRSSRLPQDSFAPRDVERIERFASQPEHLMQHAPALERVRRLVFERRFPRERFGIAKSLSRREDAAASFAAVFDQAAARQDCPVNLPRVQVPLALEPDHPSNPGNTGLDELQMEMPDGLVARTRPSHPEDEDSVWLPKTQAETHEFTRQRLARHREYIRRHHYA